MELSKPLSHVGLRSQFYPTSGSRLKLLYLVVWRKSGKARVTGSFFISVISSVRSSSYFKHILSNSPLISYHLYHSKVHSLSSSPINSLLIAYHSLHIKAHSLLSPSLHANIGVGASRRCCVLWLDETQFPAMSKNGYPEDVLTAHGMYYCLLGFSS
jgi:hypothetical protein